MRGSVNCTNQEPQCAIHTTKHARHCSSTIHTRLYLKALTADAVSHVAPLKTQQCRQVPNSRSNARQQAAAGHVAVVKTHCSADNPLCELRTQWKQVLLYADGAFCTGCARRVTAHVDCTKQATCSCCSTSVGPRGICDHHCNVVCTPKHTPRHKQLTTHRSWTTHTGPNSRTWGRHPNHNDSALLRTRSRHTRTMQCTLRECRTCEMAPGLPPKKRELLRLRATTVAALAGYFAFETSVIFKRL